VNGGSSTGLYLRVAGALYLLLGLTIACAFIDMGPFNIVVAMTIAVVKAALVVLFFMHLRSAGALTRVVACAGALWLLFMCALTLTDFLTRN